MKKLPIGIENFKYMIEKDYLYIDKTKYLHMLVDTRKYYFMSRPRRFDKSLTISTYNSMFRGEKELFKDTWLYENWDFEARPVIRLNMSTIDTRDEKAVEESIVFMLEKKTNMMKMAFAGLIERLYQKTGKRVIVLIDERDMSRKEGISSIIPTRKCGIPFQIS